MKTYTFLSNVTGHRGRTVLILTVAGLALTSILQGRGVLGLHVAFPHNPALAFPHNPGVPNVA